MVNITGDLEGRILIYPPFDTSVRLCASHKSKLEVSVVDADGGFILEIELRQGTQPHESPIQKGQIHITPNGDIICYKAPLRPITERKVEEGLQVLRLKKAFDELEELRPSLSFCSSCGTYFVNLPSPRGGVPIEIPPTVKYCSHQVHALRTPREIDPCPTCKGKLYYLNNKNYPHELFCKECNNCLRNILITKINKILENLENPKPTEEKN